MVIISVQVFAGLILPSAIIFLQLLLNDRELLGDRWVNRPWNNYINWTIIVDSIGERNASETEIVRIPLLILPGLNNSGPQHWQTLWQERKTDALRLEPASWNAPELDDWMSALDRVVEACATPPILVAHSMGCLLSVCWASQHRSDLSIAGAFLVAPPNFKRKEFPAPSFTQVPEFPLPYPALVVASTNDPYCPIEVAEELANKWRAGFVSVGPRGHISTEPGNGDWQEGWHLLEAFAAGLRVQV